MKKVEPSPGGQLLMVQCLLLYPTNYSNIAVYTGCMIGNHANQIILDNLVKQTGVFDTHTAYQAMREQVRFSSLI